MSNSNKYNFEPCCNCGGTGMYKKFYQNLFNGTFSDYYDYVETKCRQCEGSGTVAVLDNKKLSS